VNPNDDIVDRRFRLGPLHQFHSGRSRGLIRHNDCFHRNVSSALKRYDSVSDIVCARVAKSRAGSGCRVTSSSTPRANLK
jgi:hypothetical protein